MALPVLILLLFRVVFLSQPQPGLVGTWQDEAHPAKQIQFSQQPDGTFRGVSVGDQPGKLVFQALRWDAQQQVFTGVLHNPDAPGTLAVSLHLSGSDRFTFTVTKFVFSKTFHFRRL